MTATAVRFSVTRPHLAWRVRWRSRGPEFARVRQCLLRPREIEFDEASVRELECSVFAEQISGYSLRVPDAKAVSLRKADAHDRPLLADCRQSELTRSAITALIAPARRQANNYVAVFLQTCNGQCRAARTKSLSVVSSIKPWRIQSCAITASIVPICKPARRQRLRNSAASI